MGYEGLKSATDHCYSNNQSTETRYFYLGDDESKWAISTATLTEDYLRSFGKTIGYGAPLRTEEYTNGTLTGGSMTTLKLLGASDSRQLVPTTQWSPLNGNWQRVSELREWNAATQPTVTYSTLYNEAGLTNTILGTFNRTEHEYNDFLQLEKTKVFDDDEVGNVFFERSYNYNDDFSELFNSVDENNITISFEYDGLGRLREKKSNNDRITENYEYSYQPAIVLTTTTFDDGTPSQSVERRFNGLGMPTSVTRQDGAQLSVITYDNNFRTLTEKALGRPLTTQTYEASPLSRVLSTNSGGLVTSFVHTAMPSTEYEGPDFFQRTIITDPNGNYTDESGQSVIASSETVTDALGRTTATYSAVGGLTSALLHEDLSLTT